MHGTVRGRHPHFGRATRGGGAGAERDGRVHGRAVAAGVLQPASYQGAWSDPSLSFGVPFEVSGDGQYHVYYAPIWEQFSGHAVQLPV